MEQGTVQVVSDAQMWALIVGFVSPLLIAVVQRPGWSGPRRTAVAIGWSFITGGATAYFADDLTGRSLVSCFLVVAVTAIASYQSIWVPTRIAPWIEAKTSRDGEAHVVTAVVEEPQAVEDANPARE